MDFIVISQTRKISLDFYPIQQILKAYSLPLKTENALGIDGFVGILHQDKQGGFWVGTFRRGINYFDPKTGISTFYNLQENLHQFNMPWAFYENREGQLWLGYLGNSGLYKMNTYAPAFTLYPEMNKGQRSCQSSIEPHIFWIATMTNGLHQLDINTSKTTHFLPDPEDSMSIGNIVVQAAYEDKKGTLWVGIGKVGADNEKRGLVRFDRKSGKFKHYNI